MSVWDDQHPTPAGGPDFERKLLRRLTEESARQLAGARKTEPEFKRVYGGGIDVVIGRNLAEVGDVAWEPKKEADRGAYREIAGLLRNVTHQEELPVILLQPKTGTGRVAVWPDPAGKAGLFGGTGAPRPEVQLLLGAGFEVVGVDLLFQGESLADGQPVTQTRRVKNPREAAAYTFGYNPSLFAQRVHDLLSVVQFARSRSPAARPLAMVGVNGAGAWVAAACAQARGAIDLAAVDTSGFRFGRVLDLQSVEFLPGGATFGDLPGMIAFGAPRQLWLAGEGEQPPELVRAAYAEPGAGKTLSSFRGDGAAAAQEAARWLTAQKAP